jgi:hypothetical protein
MTEFVEKLSPRIALRIYTAAASCDTMRPCSIEHACPLEPLSNFLRVINQGAFDRKRRTTVLVTPPHA